MKPILTGIVLLAAAALVPAQTWVKLSGPVGRGCTFVWDSWRGRAVAIADDGATWEWNGTWLHRPTAVAPPARVQAAVAFDAARGHTLLFSGLLPNGTGIGDTWTWDGSEWRQPFSLLMPARRVGAAMAFDSSRGRVVMFGGLDQLTQALFDDTWEHDGSQWITCNPVAHPSGMMEPGMAFDVARGVTVLLGHNDQWEWNGSNWTQRPVNHPAIWSPVVLAYDAVRQRTVLSGAGLSLDEVWEWDGAAWSFRVATGIGRIGHGMAYDDRAGRVLILGGDDAMNARHSSILAWNGTAMTVPAQEHVPQARMQAALSYDPVRQRTVLVGGLGYGVFDEHWEWDGHAWSSLRVTPRPPARSGAASCFAPVGQHTLLFGGQDGATVFGDFWTWNGSVWTSLPVSGPGPRTGARMIQDTARNRVVMFGGDSPQGALDETWIFDGTTWSNVGPGLQPRWNQAMAYDVGRDRIVLYGGMARAPFAQWHGDTWEFDGTQWAAIATPTVPGPLEGMTMTYDAVTARCVMAGISQTTQRHGEIWQFDGVDWQPRGTVAVTDANSGLTMTFDQGRQRVLLMEGQRLLELTSSEATSVPFGQGCGAPCRISARSRPRTGAPAFGLEAFPGSPLAVVFALGFGQGARPLGNGCTLLLQQTLATAFTVADARGFAQLPVALPANHGLRGLVMVGQAAVLDSSAPAGFRLSAGLSITVGD